MPVAVHSFLGLDEDHSALDEIFFRHQEAILAGDFGRAASLLDEFERRIQPHMRIEDESLIPLFEERKHRLPEPKRIRGEIYSHEHRKILSLLGELKTQVRSFDSAGGASPREVIAILDRETAFKGLIEHHNLRERNHLYPELDGLTTKEERLSILSR